MEKLKFPKGFLWGGATAAEQSEGKGNTNKGETVWDMFYKEYPNKFYKTVGPNVTSDFANKYPEDIKMFKEIGANSVRLGFSWARLFPDNTETVDLEAVAFYHDILNECKKNNLKVVMTLFHFDMPKWAMEMGGWESLEVVNMFERYADFIFSEFKDEVHMYATMNEPIVPIHGGYLHGFHWPLVKDEKRAFQAGYGTVLAHAKAVNIFNDKHKNKLNATIGVVINVANAYAKDGENFSNADAKAAKMANTFNNYSFLSPMLKGEFPIELINFLKENSELMPETTKEDLEAISKVKVDYVGVNFYAPSRVQAPKEDYVPEFKHEKYFQPYTWDKAVMNVFRGWEIYPKAIYDTAQMIKENFNNLPFYISENGMGVQNEEIYRDKETGMIQDDYRIAFLNEHLAWCHKAIKDGAPLFGYHMWAIIDCWSWLNAYKNRYGFIEVDLETQKRIPKKSAIWLKETAKNNAIDAEFKTVNEVVDLKKVKFEKSS